MNAQLNVRTATWNKANYNPIQSRREVADAIHAMMTEAIAALTEARHAEVTLSPKSEVYTEDIDALLKHVGGLDKHALRTLAANPVEDVLEYEQSLNGEKPKAKANGKVNGKAKPAAKKAAPKAKKAAPKGKVGRPAKPAAKPAAKKA